MNAPARPRTPVVTPYGVIHEPPSLPVQIAVTFAAFAASIGLGALLVAAVRVESLGARVFAQAPFILTFFAGYALWTARVRALVFQALGKGILKALVPMILRRRVSARVEDIVPSRDRLLEMLVRAQKAASSFAMVAAPIGLLCAVGVALLDAAPGAVGRAVAVGLLCVQWGLFLSLLGRHGLLPIADGEESA